MDSLIDHFSPSELLHIVSIANQHGFLKTEHKRFLIALRMSSPYEDGVWSVDEEKKQRFVPILGQFLQELEPWQRCSKEECPLCDRFQALHSDFHGEQASPEFKLFMDWFMSGSRTYVAPKNETSPKAASGGKSEIELEPETFKPASKRRRDDPRFVEKPAPVQVKPVAQSVSPVSLAAAPASSSERAPVMAALPVSEKAPVAPVQSKTQSSAEHPVKEFQRTWDQPLFSLNMQHPAVRNLESLARQDLHLMDDFQLREFTARFQKLARDFLSSLDQGSSKAADTGMVTPSEDLRRIG